MPSSRRLQEIKWIATGLCGDCGKPACTRTHCAYHAARKSARAKAYYARVGVDPIRRVARAALKHAVRSGRIARPATCSRCGISDPKINGHHHDYTKPLEVTWLCYRCHAAVEGRGQR